MSQAQGNTNASAPPEVIEISLMERFHWTPQQIDEIPIGRLQRIFAAMDQQGMSQAAAQQVASARAKSSTKGR